MSGARRNWNGVQAEMNEDSEWWRAAVADMDAGSVRKWCMDGAASGVLTDWCWWEGVQTTANWEVARTEFEAFVDAICGEKPEPAADDERPWRRSRRRHPGFPLGFNV